MIDKELKKQLEAIQAAPGRPKKTEQYKRQASKEGTAIDERRATYILKDSSVERLKEIAKLTNRRIKDVAQEAIDDFINKHNI